MQPLGGSERYPQLDTLRGLALYGILLINVLTVFRVSLFAHIAGTEPLPYLVAILVEFKAFTLFAFLFGVGMAIQAERARNPPRFLLRRFIVLLAIGLVHLYLVWNGDILALYAVCGLLLIPLLPLPSAAFAAMGLLLLFFRLPVPFADPRQLLAHAAEATRMYAHGGFAAVLAFRTREASQLMLPLLVLTLPRTLGMMMLGIAAWRSGLLTARRRIWPAVLAASGFAGALGIYLDVDVMAQAGVAFAYAAAVFLWMPHQPYLAAGGRMALTNYLLQSLIFGFVFYGYGLGFFGSLSVAPAVWMATGFYVLQLLVSSWWLRHFHFGPFEWLWRSLSYGRRQPLRRTQGISCAG